MVLAARGVDGERSSCRRLSWESDDINPEQITSADLKHTLSQWWAWVPGALPKIGGKKP